MQAQQPKPEKEEIAKFLLARGCTYNGTNKHVPSPDKASAFPGMADAISGISTPYTWEAAAGRYTLPSTAFRECVGLGMQGKSRVLQRGRRFALSTQKRPAAGTAEE